MKALLFSLSVVALMLLQTPLMACAAQQEQYEASSNSNGTNEYEVIAQSFRQLRQELKHQQIGDNILERIVLAKSRYSSQVQSQSYKDLFKQLDLRHLTSVLEVREDTVRVQAKCTFGDLVEQTLLRSASKKIPAVVPEFKSITVGGAIMGGALASTSFRYGQVSDTALQYTVLLASNSSIVKVTPYHDLFHALPGSYGTLGILLDATLQLIPVMEYHPYVQMDVLQFDDSLVGLHHLYNLSTTA